MRLFNPLVVQEWAFANFVTRQVGKAEAALDDGVSTIGRRLAKPAPANTGTLFAVTGYAATERSMATILRSAARDGITAHAHAIPGKGLGSIQDAVRGLDELIAKQAPTGDIHLLGHSKGGDVAEAWLMQATPQQRARVRSLSLIASPPGGQNYAPMVDMQLATMALWGGDTFTNLGETSASSRIMQQIAKAQLPRGTRALSVMSVKDGLLSIPETMWNKGKTLILDGPDAPTHMQMLTNAKAYEAVRANVLGTAR